MMAQPVSESFLRALQRDLTLEDVAAMPCLSIMQPWAWLIANEYKDIENRAWYTHFRGVFLIHAGKKYDKSFDHAWARKIIGREVDIPGPKSAQLGGIVGMANLSACVTKSTSPWFFGPQGFVINNARPLNFLPCRGALGFFQTGSVK
jgi:hypothetical protein